MKINIGNVQLKKKIYIGNVRIGVKKIFPELEDLTVTPTATEQNFKSTKYGYNNVKVKAVEGEELNIVPTTETQQFEGLYRKVNISAIEGEELNITPNTEEQVKEGLYNKVTVAGDENLSAENIKEGVTIFGVEGTMAGAWDSSQITKCNYMFQGNETMINAPYFDTSNVNTMDSMFYKCTNLETVPKYNAKNVISMANMFAICNKLTTVPAFDTSSLDNANAMFIKCSSLKKAPELNTDKTTDIGYMFSECTSLEFVPTYNSEKVFTVSNVFYKCTKLTDLGGLLNLGKGYTRASNNYSNYKLILSTANKLTHDSLMNVINNLYDLNLTYDVANGGTLYTQGLILGSTNLAKLTAEEIAIATNKGWTVS